MWPFNNKSTPNNTKPQSKPINIREILYGPNPVDFNIPDRQLNFDLQGWNSDNKIFFDLVNEIKPNLIIEVGTWKGRSAINMAKHIKTLGLKSSIICIDTFLGAPEHWIEPNLLADMKLKNMRPQLFEQFLSNILHEGCEDIIVPFPQTSQNAFKVLKKKGVAASLIYVDGSHEEGDVYQDIKNYFSLLLNGGILFGDDYSGWEGVRKDANKFAKEYGLKLEVRDKVYWIIRKPDDYSPQLDR